jgi:hypothetical protein
MSRPQYRVFVSSVIDGFHEFRDAAGRGIERAGGEAVLVNEHQPATDRSSRNACLDAVESCDLYVVLLGARGGWIAPSGKLVVQEEYEHARKHKLPTLVFIQSVARDSDSERLVTLVSDYTDGAFRRTFSTPGDLEREIEKAVRRESKTMSLPTTPPDAVTRRLTARGRTRNEPILRVVIAPERSEEVITPMSIESAQFGKAVYAIGHAGDPSIFSYSQPKTSRVEGGALIVEQSDPNGRRDSAQYVRLSLDENGIIEVEASVAKQRGDNTFASSMVVFAADIASTLTTIFAFSAALFDQIDPHKRHQRFLYGASLLELGYRQITRDETPKSSYGMAMGRGDEPLAAFEGTRTLSREDLAAPADEIARTVTMLERASRGS